MTRIVRIERMIRIWITRNTGILGRLGLEESQNQEYQEYWYLSSIIFFLKSFFPIRPSRAGILTILVLSSPHFTPMAKDRIIQFIDFFYPLFRKFMPLQTFRYAVCGGTNTLLGLFIYTVTYKYILHEQILHLGFYAFKPHIAALFIAFCINFPLGFLLMKFVVFHDSTIKGRIQLFRYFVIFVSSLFINYWLLKLLVEVLHVYAVVAQVITTTIIVLFSYIMQRHYSFRKRSDLL